MIEQLSLRSDRIRSFEAPSSATDFMEAPRVIGSASPSEGLPSETQATAASSVTLSLEDLKCFEVVERQFQNLGVMFRNAIALHPSNPAFPARSGATVLLGAPKSGFLEIIFSQPVRFIRAYVTSSQRTILTAYDCSDKVLARTEMPGPNLAGSDSAIPPNKELSLSVPNIERVTFYAFDGQVTIDDLSFDF